MRAKIVIACACVTMGLTTFLTMRQSIKRSMAQQPDNPMMQTQKFMMYLAPLFGLFGLMMPVGVLVYWVTSNTWTMGQQNILYRNQPTSDGESKDSSGPAKGMLGRKKEPEPEPKATEEPKIVRNQPKRQPRSKRGGGAR
jgi:YidC/Oxa1 family membrane protein insertase